MKISMPENNTNIYTIKGYGWIKEKECGSARKCFERNDNGFQKLYARLTEEGVIAYPVENFGRFDKFSRLAVISTALSLYDAGVHYDKVKKQDIGILGTSWDGALDPDLAYFRDYVGAGRKLARGNLFIYTLPSSPLAEAAIHFGLQGPLLYMQYPENPRENLLAQAELMLKNKEAEAMLAVFLDTVETRCYYISGAEA